MTTVPRLRALVVDDEALARRRLLAFLAEEKEIEVIGEAVNGSGAVEAIARHRPDIVFLDVQMPGLDGFGVLRCTAGAHMPAVVFVTASEEHAIRAFEVQAVDYLTKPITAARLRETVRRVVARARSSSQKDKVHAVERVAGPIAASESSQRIPIKGIGGTTLLRVADIDWVEADGDHLRIHSSGQIHTPRETIASFGDRLPRDKFLRIHRSTIVNVSRVREIRSVPGGGYLLVMQCGRVFRSGRTYRKAVQTLIR